MTRVLLLGGYGGFGGRMAEELAKGDWEVLVAGRSLQRAASFCAGRPNLIAVRLDRNADEELASAFQHFRPFAVIDATGPFQEADYRVPRACISAGVHYLDIADAREFVAGIGVLDAEAKRAGVSVIAGASTVPALTQAVAGMLAKGISEVRSVEMAITASNRAAAGPSVTAAIVSCLGRAFTLWRGRRWIIRHGWQEMRRQDFTIAEEPPLLGRLIALADVPDHVILPQRLPGSPAVTFRAGTEFGIQNRALWLIGWIVRRRLLNQSRQLVPGLLRLQHLMASFGSDRSGMIVRLFGLRGLHRIERRWTLIADRGSGPDIPALCVPILLRHLREGMIASGARDAGGLLTLQDFEPSFSSRAIRHEIVDHDLPPPLYERVLGASFRKLPQAVRKLHDVLRDDGAVGRAQVSLGRNPFARAIATAVGFPKEGEHDLHVTFSEAGGTEIWTRTFSGRSFRSHLTEKRGTLTERFGPLTFLFDLKGDSSGITMCVVGWRLGPFRLARALAPRSVAREWEEGSRFCFDVPISLPWVGLLVHYRDWLERPMIS